MLGAMRTTGFVALALLGALATCEGCFTLSAQEMLPAVSEPAKHIGSTHVEGLSVATVGTTQVAFAALRLGDGTRRVYIDTGATVPSLPRTERRVALYMLSPPEHVDDVSDRPRLDARDPRASILLAGEDGRLQGAPRDLAEVEGREDLTLVGIFQNAGHDELCAVFPAPRRLLPLLGLPEEAPLEDEPGKRQQCRVSVPMTEASGPSVGAVAVRVLVFPVTIALDGAALPVEVVAVFIAGTWLFTEVLVFKRIN